MRTLRSNLSVRYDWREQYMKNLRMVGTIGSLWLLVLVTAVIFVAGKQMLAIRSY